MDGKQKPAAAAVSRFLQALQESEGMALKGAPAAKEEAGKARGADECPGCAAGACDNPEHMAEEDVAGLSEAYR